MARINIEVDEKLLNVVMRRYGMHTEGETIDLALRCLAGRALTYEEILSMRGANLIDVTPVDTGP